MLALTRSSLGSRTFGASRRPPGDDANVRLTEVTFRLAGLALRHQLASRPYATAPPPKTDGPAPYVPPATDVTNGSVPPLASSSSSSSSSTPAPTGRSGTGLKAKLDEIKAENDRAFEALGPAEQEAKIAKDKRGAFINLGLVSVGLGILAYSFFFVRIVFVSGKRLAAPGRSTDPHLVTRSSSAAYSCVSEAGLDHCRRRRWHPTEADRRAFSWS
jgi:hypothetical protein